jgi:hypothetical protein
MKLELKSIKLGGAVKRPSLAALDAPPAPGLLHYLAAYLDAGLAPGPTWPDPTWPGPTWLPTRPGSRPDLAPEQLDTLWEIMVL